MSATERPESMKRWPMAAVLAVGCLLLGVAGMRATVRHLNAQRELARLEEEIAQIRNGNDRLERSLERMKQPAWLALLARDRLNYKRPDETVVFVYKSQKADTIAPPHATPVPRPNWRIWWDWLVGE